MGLENTRAGIQGGKAAGRRYVLIVLTAVFAFNHLDRQILSILLEKIRLEFGLSDTALGLLSGPVFAAVFVTLGLPAAVWAAQGNRRNLVALSLGVWSLMTALCGLAQNFWQLALARFGVGVGEAGCVPPSHSMISDLYPRGQRAGALAVYSAGANAGIFLAFLIGGLVGHAVGWRWAFLAAAIPGLALAVLLRFTVREPERERSEDAPPSPIPAGTARMDWSILRPTAVILWRDRVLRHMLVGSLLAAIIAYGLLAWVPSFVIRTHGLSLAQTGLLLAVSVGILGGIGTALGGFLADRLGRRDPRWYPWVTAAAIFLSKAFLIGFFLADGVILAFAFQYCAAFFAGVFLGPTFALLHDRVSIRARPLASAIVLFVFNLIGLGLGPFLAGLLSDTVFAGAGEHSLRWALIVMQIAGLWAVLHYLIAAIHMGRAEPASGVQDGP